MKTAVDYLAGRISACSCDRYYTKRGLTAPDCFWCNNHEDIIDVMKEYAKQAIEEQLKIAAQELEENPYRAFFVGAAREVLNCTRIKLD